MTGSIYNHIIPLSYWIASFIILIAISSTVVLVHRLYLKEKSNVSVFHEWYDHLIKITRTPFIFFICVTGLFIIFNIIKTYSNLPIPDEVETKLSKLFLIGMIGWLFYKVVDSLSYIIMNQYRREKVDIITTRKVHTQVLILKRIIISIGVIITFASMLMVFDSVRNLGTGLLTTAGIIGTVGAFASQQSLARLFAGLQIAFTQPIRIGDTVIIDNEFGQIEEITLSYIVVKLWDLRRLILPTDYFTNKGLQNLTRESTQLLGTVFIYADYTLPVATVRKKFQTILNESSLWDKKVSAFEVTNITETALEIRALMSADNASTLWNLRCEVREKLMDYIVKHHPECLAAKRSLNVSSDKDVISKKNNVHLHNTGGIS